MKFLNYDSPFMNFLRRLVDYVCVGILWLLVSVPVITFGAGCTAALQTVERVIRNEEGKITPTFFRCFRKEFKQATLLWLLQLPILIILLLDFWMVQGSSLANWFQVVILVATGVVFCWTQLWFGYLSKFVDKNRTLLSNTFKMLLGSLGRALLLGVLGLLAIIGMLVSFVAMPPLFFVVPGIYLVFYHPLSNKFFERFIPKEEPEETEGSEDTKADQIAEV